MYLENSIHCFSRSGTLLEQKKKKKAISNEIEIAL